MSAPPALDVLISGLGARKNAAGWKASCPAHDDHDPSLAITTGPGGRVLVHCHAGCAQEAVLDALRQRALWPLPAAPIASTKCHAPVTPQRPIAATYDYRDATGTLLYQVVRYEPKDFRQRRPDGAGRWTWKLDGAPRVPYRLPELLAADPNETVHVVEGEKDVDRLRSVGLVATCNVGGAEKWRDEYSDLLRGRNVAILPDNDEAGGRHAAQVEHSLQGKARSVAVVRLPNLPAKGDVSDWLDAGHTAADLRALVDAPPEPPRTVAAVAPVAVVEESEALDGVAAFLRRYVVFPSPEAGDAVALWVAHTHAVDAFESTPRLALLSAEKQSGKTRCLEVAELLAPNARHASNLTAAALFRLVGVEQGCTLLFDEVDVFFGHRAKEHEELRGLLNAGHRRGAVAYRCVGEPTKMEVRAFPAFCPVALAGIGDLPDTILDRSILIRMRRRAPEETVQPFRHREASTEGQELRNRLAQWAAAHRDALRDARPAMPAGLSDRPADVWEPLLAIADVAGGDWPERARSAAVRLNGERQSADASLGARLLADIRSVFDAQKADRLASAALVDALVAMDEAPWGDLRGKALDARGLARRLKPFDIRPHSVRMDDATPKGYERADFADAWRRYLSLPGAAATSATPQHPRSDGAANAGPCGGPNPQRDAQPQRGFQVGVADVAAVAAFSGYGAQASTGTGATGTPQRLPAAPALNDHSGATLAGPSTPICAEAGCNRPPAASWHGRLLCFSHHPLGTAAPLEAA